MKDTKKIVIILVFIAAIFLILNSTGLTNKSVDKKTDDFENQITTPGNDYTKVTYVKKTNNVFIVVAKFMEKIVTFVIEGAFNIIGKGFELIFGI